MLACGFLCLGMAWDNNGLDTAWHGQAGNILARGVAGLFSLYLLLCLLFNKSGQQATGDVA